MHKRSSQYCQGSLCPPAISLLRLLYACRQVTAALAQQKQAVQLLSCCVCAAVGPSRDQQPDKPAASQAMMKMDPAARLACNLVGVSAVHVKQCSIFPQYGSLLHRQPLVLFWILRNMRLYGRRAAPC